MGGPTLAALGTFYNIDKNMRRTLKNHQIDLDANPEAVPSDIFQTMRSAAVQLVHEDPAFLADYNRFFSKVYGPITRAI